MRWFFDTEFYENGRTIELISIGLVSEDGKGYYWETSNARNLAASTPWLTENVLPHLRGGAYVAPRETIAYEISLRLLPHPHNPNQNNPELWAYFADYDWVAFCQLYGRMIDLPERYPKYCMDLKQLMKERGIKRDDIPVTKRIEHDALCDAEWARDTYLWIQQKPRYFGLEGT